jgi:Zn finger protein HypA/HybF involved in hydrogenase expression
MNSAAYRFNEDEDVWTCNSCNWIGPESCLKISNDSTVLWYLCPKCSSALVELYLDSDKEEILEAYYNNQTPKTKLTSKTT